MFHSLTMARLLPLRSMFICQTVNKSGISTFRKLSSFNRRNDVLKLTLGESALVCSKRHVTGKPQKLIPLCYSCIRSYSDITGRGNDGSDDIDNKAVGGMQEEMQKLIESHNKKQDNVDAIPRETDIVIIGGGSIGLSVAYWLKQRNPVGFSLTVVERDPTYTRAATTLSVASIRQQFSLPENIKMSMFSAEFLRNIREYLSVLDLDPPDIQFNPQGYLLLASDECGADALRRNNEIQKSCGAMVEIMDRDALKSKFQWLNTSDLTLGSYGLANEGWFDPWLYLTALKVKCMSLGVNFVKGEVTGFNHTENVGMSHVDGSIQRKQHLRSVTIRTDENKTHDILFAMCANCAGPWSGEVGRLAGIGSDDTGVNNIPIPVEPRKRYVYVFHAPTGPGLDTPMLIDSCGVYVRREGLGGYYICGASPKSTEEEPDTSDLEVDYQMFEDVVWPALAHRIPAFENLKLKSAWAGFYDYNYFDQNLIIGNHPYFRNMMIATGCSGHGIQQSPAIGRAMAEYILDQEYQTIDLSRFSFDRILDDEPVLEDCGYII